MKWMVQIPALHNINLSNWKGREIKEDLIRMEALKMNCSFGFLHEWMNSQWNYYESDKKDV